jgi:polyphosphate kinase 2
MTKTEKRSKQSAREADFRVETLPDAITEAALASGDFPYDKRLKEKAYEKELKQLQIELVKLVAWVKEKGERVAIVFEGRDAAGKGGAIQRLTQHLNPRQTRIVALSKPTPTEAGQWYFQRYIAHLPTRGEIAIFDRSWYNRAIVEPVFGFCTPAETKHFLDETPHFEAMLTRDGVRLFKFFLTVGKEMQIKRLNERWNDPLERWKISDIDMHAIEKWDDYSAAIERMLKHTDREAAPWTVIRANDKRRSRLETIRHVLDNVPYQNKDVDAVGKPDRKIAISAKTFLAKGGEEES